MSANPGRGRKLAGAMLGSLILTTIVAAFVFAGPAEGFKTLLAWLALALCIAIGGFLVRSSVLTVLMLLVHAIARLTRITR